MQRGRFPQSWRLLSLTAVVLTAIAGASASVAQSSSPLTMMAGSWTGGGTITLSDGTRERLRCRSTYTPDAAGANMSLSLTCASDSYKFDLASQVVYSGGRISGNWNEAGRNAAGQISGTANGGQIEARVDGQTFAAFVAINTRGDKQSVNIRSPGSTMQEVAITLSRR
jgi:hypothetical protein